MPVTKTEPGYSTEQIENDLGALRGQVDGLSEYAEIATLVITTGFLTAAQPGTSTEPATQETWHTFTPLSGSWSVPSGGYARYRITPQNELQITAWMKAPGASVNGVTIATFPTGYQPASTHGVIVAADSLNASISGFVTITSSGVMQATGIAASANCYIEARIPLDV